MEWFWVPRSRFAEGGAFEFSSGFSVSDFSRDLPRTRPQQIASDGSHGTLSALTPYIPMY